MVTYYVLGLVDVDMAVILDMIVDMNWRLNHMSLEMHYGIAHNIIVMNWQREIVHM